MVYIYRAWIARIKEESSSLNIRFLNAIFLFIPNINLSLTLLVLATLMIDHGQYKNRFERHGLSLDPEI
jgi:hypothetical protein